MTPTRLSAKINGPAAYVALRTNSYMNYLIGALFFIPFYFIKEKYIGCCVVAFCKRLPSHTGPDEMPPFATFYLGFHFLPKNAFKRHQYIKG